MKKDLLISVLVHITLIAGLWSVNWANPSDARQVRKPAALRTTAQREATKKPVKSRELRKPTQKELAEIAALFEAMQKQPNLAGANPPPTQPPVKPADQASAPPASPSAGSDHKAPPAPPPIMSASSPPISAAAPPMPPGASAKPIDYAGEARSVAAPSAKGGIGVAVAPASAAPRAERSAKGIRAPEYEFADTTGKIHRLLLDNKQAFILILPTDGKDTFVFDGAICWKDNGSVLAKVATRSPTMPPELVRAALAALAQSEYGTSRAAADVRFVTTNPIDNAILAAQSDAAQRINKPLEQIAVTRVSASIQSVHLIFSVTQATLQDQQVISIH